MNGLALIILMIDISIHSLSEVEKWEELTLAICMSFECWLMSTVICKYSQIMMETAGAKWFGILGMAVPTYVRMSNN